MACDTALRYLNQKSHKSTLTDASPALFFLPSVLGDVLDLTLMGQVAAAAHLLLPGHFELRLFWQPQHHGL